jgi:hypothetical protein
MKFYDELVDTADETRPVSVALRNSMLWLKNATFANIRNFIWSGMVEEELLEEIDEELWQIALKQKMLKSAAPKKGEEDRWERVQKDAKPFFSPFHWAAFRAHGSCGGVHDPMIADRDEFDEIKENDKFEQHYDEFDANDGYVDNAVVKLAKKGAKAGGDALRQPAADLAVKLKEKKAMIKEKAAELGRAVDERKEGFDVDVEARKAAMRERGERAKDAIRNAPKLAKELLQKERKEAAERKRGDTLHAAMGKPKGKGKKGKGGKRVKEVKDGDEDGSASDGSSSDEEDEGDDDDDDFENQEFSSVAELRKLREKRKGGSAGENGGSKACSIQ